MTDSRPVSPLATPPEEVAGHNLLAGKKAIVTAAAGTGIGFATARRILLEGGDVLVSDFHERRLGETVEKLSAEFPNQQVVSFVCDVSSTEQVNELFASAASQLGRIDVVVNNAGLGGETPVVDMTDEQWDRVVDITLNSTFRATRAALAYFRDAPHGGIIVNNASVLGWRAQRGQAHYAAAKAGVMALTRCSAVEAADYGVRINAVAPSIAKHPFLAKVTSDDLLDELASREAYGRAA
ncbi:MAG: SDR family oxidoreductase, partial [Gordonia sp. (in: high G+C Gram-positive bacteria)]